MIDWKYLLPEKSSIVVWLVLLAIYYFVGCTSYPNITMGYDPCPHYCGVDHKHKLHPIDYDCGQKVCIHKVIKK